MPVLFSSTKGEIFIRFAISICAALIVVLTVIICVLTAMIFEPVEEPAPIETVKAELSCIVPFGVEVVDCVADTDYMTLMLECARNGDENSMIVGAIYEGMRNLRIDTLGEDEPKTAFFSNLDSDQVAVQIEDFLGIERPSQPVMYYTEDDVIMVSKVLYNECRGSTLSTIEKACVAWTILNRVDDGWGTISEVITEPKQFAYSHGTPVWDNLYIIAKDVLERWNAEQNGQTDVGRVLPREYKWFGGQDGHNWFRDKYDMSQGDHNIWDYSLPNPYEE